MKLKTAVALSIGSTLLLPACATITRGTSQKFEIVSEPPEATVQSSTGFTCVTPCKMKVKRKPGFDLTISKPGYQTQTVTVESSMSGGGGIAGAGNILLGGVIGGIVDGTNGSMNSLSPNPVTVTLIPNAAAPAAAMEAAKAADAAAEAAGDAASAAGDAAAAAEDAAAAAAEAAAPQ